MALLALFLGSCAASYKPIMPENLHYNQANISSEGLSLRYRYNVLSQTANKKYAKKEMKRDIQLVAVEITNAGKQVVTIGEDVMLYANDQPLVISEPAYVHARLKQVVPTYLLYLLLTPMQITSTGSNGESNVTPIGLAIGPGITALNIITASTANSNFRDQLTYYNLKGRTVQPGETVYGLVGLPDTGSAPLGIRRTKLTSDADSYYRED